MTSPIPSNPSFLPTFEGLEQRVLLSDVQVGSVTMPYTGYLSAAVYDANGNYIGTLQDSAGIDLAAASKSAGTVTLWWDGKDDVGRLVEYDETYTWKALFSQVEAIEQGGVGDSVFPGEPYPLLDNNPGSSEQEAAALINAVATNTIGGVASTAGGTFAKALVDAWYGDTSIATYTLANAITSSGTLSVHNITQEWGNVAGSSQFFVGHFSQVGTDARREYLGLQISRDTFGYGTGQVEVTGRLKGPDGSNFTDTDPFIISTSTDHTFSFVYDPGLGSYGRISLTIDGVLKEKDLSSSERNSGAAFDAFGMGYTNNQNSETNSAATAQGYIDDVQYTGHTGVVDFSTNPGWTGSNNSSNGNSFGYSQIEQADGSVYSLSEWEEGHLLTRWAQDGSPIWVSPYRAIYGTGIAVDNDYVYFSTRTPGTNETLIHRLYARDGTWAPFSGPSGVIAVNGAYNPWPDQSWYTTDQERQRFALWGLATDGQGRLFASNYRTNYLEVYDSDTGVKIGQMALNSPLGVAVQSTGATSGVIWVANNKDRVSRYTYSVSGGVVTFSAEDSSRRIVSPLSDPGGVVIGGTNGHLFVAEFASGNVHEYDISGPRPMLAGIQTLGSLKQWGDITDTEFYFTYWASIAVDTSGILSVNDRNRVQRFYTEGAQAGQLYQSWHSQWSGSPNDFYDYEAGGVHKVLDGGIEYEVDPEYTGGPRAGWLGDGTWRMIGRYPGTVRRTLMDGQTQREFVYAMAYHPSGILGVYAYALEPAGVRLAAIASSGWTGSDFLLAPQKGQYNWTDTDLDGKIDGGTVGSGDNDGEVSWYINKNLAPDIVGKPWVDNSGNIFILKSNGNLVKVPLEGFSSGNPIYNWDNAVTVVPFTNDDFDYTPNVVRVAANGDIYSAGYTVFAVANAGVPGGDWVARYDSNGNRLLLRPSASGETYCAIAADDADPSPEYFVAGGVLFMDMFTNDGLVVKTWTSETTLGWIDWTYGLGMFTHPITGETYVYEEDIVNDRSIRYRIDGLETVQRIEGTFAWDVPSEISGRWKLDGNTQDSVRTKDGVFYGGTPSYVEGKVGTAIDLDGVDDRIAVAYTPGSSYTIAGWVKPTNVTSTNIFSVDTGSGTYSANLRINSAGKFEHYTRADGGTVTITGTTPVQSETWYHVAIVADNYGMVRLYVNGVEEGTARSINELTTMYHSWLEIGAAAPFLGMCNFDGVVDDIQAFAQPLDAAAIAALYNEIAFDVDGHWSMDSNVNDVAGTKNGTVNGGAGYAGGMFNNAIDLDGSNDYVDLPYTTAPTSYTISAWVKPSDVSSVNIITRTSSAGPTSLWFDQLRINASGQFEHYTSDGAGKTVTGTTVAQANTWYHVVATASSNGTMRLYVNGQEEGTAVTVGNISTAGDRFYVGSNSGGGMGYFDGLVDDVRIYNEAATDLDVHNLFQIGEVTDYKSNWNFENNLQDSTGANHGTYYNGTAGYQAGITGTALSMEGNEYAVMPYVATNHDAYAISLWVKPADTTPATIVALSTNNPGEGRYQLRINADGKFEHYRYGTFDPSVSATYVQANQWYHIVIQAASNGEFEIYVNGVRDNVIGYEDYGVGTLWSSFTTLRLGQAYEATGYYNGLIDNMRYYERRLTAEEINSVFRGKVTPVINEGNSTVTATAGANSFTISRTNTDGDITVNYTVTGTATSASDFSAIGTSVVIPNGKSTATITVVPIDDTGIEGNETVILTLQSGTGYTPSGSAATVTISDNETYDAIFSAAPTGWTGSNNAANGNSFGYSSATSQAGGATGEIGGRFAKSATDSYYGDTNFARPYNLTDVISASGKLDLTNIQATWSDDDGSNRGAIFLGHFSVSPSSNEFLGLELLGNDTTTGVTIRAIYHNTATGEQDVTVGTFAINGNHTFSYWYDPTYESNGNHAGPEGRLTVKVDSTTVTMDLSAGMRDNNGRFDAFGMGYVPLQNSGTMGSGHYADFYVDDVSYTGVKAAPEPDTVTVSATDNAATEEGSNTGTYTFYRTKTKGSLPVAYTMTGTGSNGTDYATLSGTVIIHEGQTSAVVTLTPIDDVLVDSGETAIATVAASAGYSVGSPGSATVTITDIDGTVPTVTIIANDPTAAEQGQGTGQFTVTRSTSSGALTVNYSISGTAANGTDFSALATSVVIAAGQFSATITVSPIDDELVEGTETVILTLAAGSYSIGTPSAATVSISDNESGAVQTFSSDPGWTGTGNTTSGNNYAYSSSTSYAGGGTGEIGGTFARNSGESSYADTSLSKSLTFADAINASGKFTVFGQDNTDGGWFLGHLSSSASDGSAVGIEFLELSSTAARFRAKVQGYGFADVTSTTYVINNDDYNFEYTYDPSLGSYGRLTVRVFNAGYDQSVSVDLTNSVRNETATCNAFGIGIQAGVASDNNAARTVQMYIDDVAYSGFVYAKDTFETGNGTGGSGWGGNWTFSGAASVVSTGTPQSGSYHMQLTGNGASATRAIDPAGVYNARLVFGWKANSFEPGETAVVEVYNGTIWQTVLTVSDGQDDNTYHNADIDLSSYTLTSSFQVRIRSLMSATDDYFYIDNLFITR